MSTKEKNPKLVAKIVYSYFITRTVVPENFTEEEIIEQAQKDLVHKIKVETLGEHVEKIVDDTECPFDYSNVNDDKIFKTRTYHFPKSFK